MKNIILSEFTISTIQSDRSTVNSILIVAIDLDHPDPGKVVGTAEVVGVDNPSPCLMSMCVDPRYRRQGIGRALALKAISIAQQWNCKRIWLSTSKDNLEAIALYDTVGFVETGPCKENGIYMQKSLEVVHQYETCTSTGPQHLNPDPEPLTIGEAAQKQRPNETPGMALLLSAFPQLKKGGDALCHNEPTKS